MALDGERASERERQSEGAALAVLTLLARLTRAVMSLSHGPTIYLLTQLSLSPFPYPSISIMSFGGTAESALWMRQL